MKPNKQLSTISNKVLSIESWLRILDSEINKFGCVDGSIPLNPDFVQLVITGIRKDKDIIKKSLNAYVNSINL